MDRSILQNNVMHYFEGQIVLRNNGETKKKTPVDRKTLEQSMT